MSRNVDVDDVAFAFALGAYANQGRPGEMPLVL